MSRLTRIALLGTAALLLPTVAWAQWPSELVTFETDSCNQESSREMFRTPQMSGSTDMYVVLNTPGEYDWNNTYHSSWYASEGSCSLNVWFHWVDPNDPRAWVRVSSFNAPLRPNPSLHLAGKVRFEITNVGELIEGGSIGICLGIRETGVNVPQLHDGGTDGTIEWVGATGFIPDPNDPNGVPTPIPAVILPTSPFPVQMEWDLLTGVVSVDGTPQGGGIVPFTGDGVLSADNDRGTLEHIAIVNVDSENNVRMDFVIDRLQVEAPVPDVVLPPRVVWPIINGDEQVTVTDLQQGVDRVNLLLNHEPYLYEDVTTTDDVIFDLTTPAETGQIYTATQVIDEQESEESDPVEVLPGPPTYTYSVLIDEGGTGSCTTAYGWEFAGATDFEASGGKWSPTGQPLFLNDAEWQTIDIPFDVVTASPYGNGELGPSPNEVYTMDSVWFTLADPNAASDPNDPNNPIYWEVFIDAVQVLDEAGQPGEMVMDFEDGVRRFIFPRGQSPDELNYEYSNLSTIAAYDGSASHRFEWYYDGLDLESIGFLQRISSACGTATPFADTSTALRFHVLARGQRMEPDVPLPQVVGPIIGAQDTVRIINDPNAVSVELFIDSESAGAQVPSGTETDFTGLSLSIDQSVSAKQELPGRVVSDFAYPRAVSDRVPAPIVEAPLIPGTTTVTVMNVTYVPFAQADPVTVIVRDPNDVILNTYEETPTGDSVDVIVDPLDNGYQVSATQTVNGVTSAESERVIVEFRTPVIHHLAAEGDTEVRVLLAYENATVTVTLRDPNDVVVDSWSGSPDPGNEYVDIAVSGLVAGYTLIAKQTVEGIDSAESVPDIVTVSTETMIFEDTMEGYATQDDYENEFDPNTGAPILSDTGWWPSSDDPGLILNFVKNTTVGGSQCVYCPGEPSPPTYGFYDGWRSNHDFTWRIHPLDPADPTDTEPIIWSFFLYDRDGPGFDYVNQWASLMDYTTGSLGGMISVGMTASEWSGWGVEDYDGDYYHARVIWGGPDYINLNEIDGPMRSKGWHLLTMVIKPTTVDFYVDGKLSKKNVPHSHIPYDNLYMGAGYRPLHRAYYDDFRVRQGKVVFDDREPQPPAELELTSPLAAGDTTVTVTDVAPDAVSVHVYADGSDIGSATPIPGETSLDVPVTELVHLDSITAKQANTVGLSDPSDPLEVGKGNGDILVCICIRETGDTGPLGTPGTTGGEYDFEWIGATGTATEEDAPLGEPISPSSGWQTLTFDPSSDPITAWYYGDGVITETRGILEHLAVTVDAASADRSTGPYEVYIDNVVNVGAGEGGTDFVIADFDGYPLESEVLFQEPGYSGSTDGDMMSPPNYSGTSDAYGNPGQSQLLSWFWIDTAAERWARISTYDTQYKESPIIDLTKPIRMDVLLVPAEEGCPYPGASGYYCSADVYTEGDSYCKIDLQDLGALLASYGLCVGDPGYNPAADFNDDDCVTLSDLGVLLTQYGDDCTVP